MGFPVKEVPLPLTMLDRAQEAFVTNAVVGVVPLTAMEGQRFQVRLTQRLRTRFLSHVCGRL